MFYSIKYSPLESSYIRQSAKQDKHQQITDKQIDTTTTQKDTKYTIGSF